MNEYGRTFRTLQPVAEDLYHFASVPFIYRDLDPDEAAEINPQLTTAALSTFEPCLM